MLQEVLCVLPIPFFPLLPFMVSEGAEVLREAGKRRVPDFLISRGTQSASIWSQLQQAKITSGVNGLIPRDFMFKTQLQVPPSPFPGVSLPYPGDTRSPWCQCGWSSVGL